jgi:hypothetical protein
MSEWWIEFILLVGAAFVLIDGRRETHRMALLRASLTAAFAAGAVVVWALARYWS